METELYVYVDVDDTMVRSVGAKRIPIPSVIQHVRNLKNQTLAEAGEARLY